MKIKCSLWILSIIVLISCKQKSEEQQTEAESPDARVIEIVTESMDFQMPDTIPSGWNTFRYKNQSPQTHFFLVDQYPEGKTSAHAMDSVAPVFDDAMKLIMEGKSEEGFGEFAKLPKWFGEVVFVGGSGLLSPNQVAETTFHLKPGQYVVECYVKMSNGMFHTSMGMVKDLVVTDSDSGMGEPTADTEITISSSNGIVFNDTISSGERIFSVYYKDQTVHENFVGHDINLVKLDENANLAELENWMNWADPKGLIEPAPQAVTFLGGVNDMPQGSKGYFKTNLLPGNYMLISEVPNASEKNLMKIFAVSE